jgi:hypothetical protein
VRLPWAEARARFTSLFERLAIDVLKETDIRGATRILRISWDEAWHILERAVERGQRAKCPRVTPHLGVDEKAIAKGHQYLTRVCDLDRATVEYIAEDRKQASLAGYFTSLTVDQLAGIAAIALDMWEPYIQALRAHVPEAETKIVYDRFDFHHRVAELYGAISSLATIPSYPHSCTTAHASRPLSGSRRAGRIGELSISSSMNFLRFLSGDARTSRLRVTRRSKAMNTGGVTTASSAGDQQVPVGDEPLIEHADLAVEDQRAGGETAGGSGDVTEPCGVIDPAPADEAHVTPVLVGDVPRRSTAQESPSLNRARSSASFSGLTSRPVNAL